MFHPTPLSIAMPLSHSPAKKRPPTPPSMMKTNRSMVRPHVAVLAHHFAAFTIATMPALTASGRVGHASIRCWRSWSTAGFVGGLLGVLLGLAGVLSEMLDLSLLASQGVRLEG